MGRYRKTKKYRPSSNGNGDEFSHELKKQGEDGRFMSMLYLTPWPMIYKKRVSDEPVRA